MGCPSLLVGYFLSDLDGPFSHHPLFSCLAYRNEVLPTERLLQNYGVTYQWRNLVTKSPLFADIVTSRIGIGYVFVTTSVAPRSIVEAALGGGGFFCMEESPKPARPDDGCIFEVSAIMSFKVVFRLLEGRHARLLRLQGVETLALDWMSPV